MYGILCFGVVSTPEIAQCLLGNLAFKVHTPLFIYSSAPVPYPPSCHSFHLTPPIVLPKTTCQHPGASHPVLRRVARNPVGLSLIKTGHAQEGFDWENLTFIKDFCLLFS
jgi:hypothetical protein